MIKTNTRAHGSGPISFVSPLMSTGVACRAQRDQVLLGVGSGVAPKLFVVDLQVRHGAAGLTPPAIATQHLAAAALRKTSDPAVSGEGRIASSS